MSELLYKKDNRGAIHVKLLTGASVVALTAYVSSATTAMAADAGRPQLWLEVGGQFSRLTDKRELYSPPFLFLEPTQFDSPQSAMEAPRYGLDVTGAATFQPEKSNWKFTASLRYGHTGRSDHFHQQSYPSAYHQHFGAVINLAQPFAAQFIDAKVNNDEKHTILDFQVGRDVGLGIFGYNAESSLNLGVRFAQFGSNSNVALHEDPDWYFKILQFGPNQLVEQPYHTFAGEFEAERSFHGVGPALSWKSSAPFAGNAQDGELTLDWGVNGSLLFGRQRSRNQHHETAQYATPHFQNFPKPRITLYHHPVSAPAYYAARSRNITVPNVGGSIGLSWKLQNFKMSLGYRADFFFGAIDGGIDSRKTYDRNFYGPFANVSIGLGG